MSKYSIKLVEDYSKWDFFVDHSPQGTPFSTSSYLSAANVYWKTYWIRKGNQIKAGLCLVLDERNGGPVIDELVIYSGIMFKIEHDHKLTKARAERFEITEFIINWIDANFDNIEMSLSPTFEDLRPFLWHNYHSIKNEDKFKHELRYTSILDISEMFLRKPDSQSKLFAQIDSKRQTDIRRAVENNLSISNNISSEQFILMYELTMRTQGVIPNREMLVRMKSLINELCKINAAVMACVRNRNREITYAVVFLHRNNAAYYLFGAGNPELQDRYDGTYCLWEMFKQLSSLGINSIDMEGVNSPKRGAFKLGFGGSLQPYFHIRKNNYENLVANDFVNK